MRRRDVDLGQVVLTAIERGLQLTRDHGELVIRGQADALDAVLAEKISRLKPVLLPELGEDKDDGKTWMSPSLYASMFWAPRREWHIDVAGGWTSTNSGGVVHRIDDPRPSPKEKGR